MTTQQVATMTASNYITVAEWAKMRGVPISKVKLSTGFNGATPAYVWDQTYVDEFMFDKLLGWKHSLFVKRWQKATPVIRKRYIDYLESL